MYFLYIYNIMTNINSRIILIAPPHKKLNQNEVLSYIMSTINVINCIDNDNNVKNACDMVNMERKTIKSYDNVATTSFHQDILDKIDNIKGTQFLIYKN
jgi:hypothetical protein